ncbi:type II secretion system protein GspL [uncultured Sphingomonas sp.]|uniref:type II secretion system protein GspL n=1 Tax=uncultured Sphingomonas sp. TaxID=158754 RepID=UPI0025F784CA|nr:type II secretion system protein GspL [uncultured Sphingomonas sp.]
MTATTLLFVPPAADQPWRWWRMRDDVLDEGEGMPPVEADATNPVVAVAPADAVTLHWAALPARSAAQAAAAARIVVSDATATPGDLHVAVGVAREGDDGEERAIAVVSPERMAAWLAEMNVRGIDPVAMLPAPLLLPTPEEGWLRGDVAGQAVVRGRSAGFADEARLTELILGDTEPVALARDEVWRAAADAAATWPLDLRQGPFARRTRRAIDWATVRRLGLLVAAILLATLAIDLVRIARYSLGADTLEARANAVARQGLPRGAGEGDAARMLGERLSRLRGPGSGFSRTAAAVYQIVQAVPDSEVTALDFQPTGALRVSLSVAGEGQANSVKTQLERAGFTVTSGVFQQSGGRLTGDLTVAP